MLQISRKDFLIGSFCLVLTACGTSTQVAAGEQGQRPEVERAEIRHDLEEVIDSALDETEKISGRVYSPKERLEIKTKLMNKYYQIFRDKYILIDRGDIDIQDIT